MNYTNIARECGINQRAVRTYFDILEDSFLGFRLPAWTKSKKRRMIMADKFYFFDVGVAGYLSRRQPQPGNNDFGKAFEHLILMELRAYQTYRDPEMSLCYWRTSSGSKVDFLLGDHELAVEVKSGKVHEGDLRGLKALHDDTKTKKRIVVCLEKIPRRTMEGIEVISWDLFLTSSTGHPN